MNLKGVFFAGLACVAAGLGCSGQSTDAPGGQTSSGDRDASKWVWTTPMNGHLGQAVHHHGLAAHADGGASFSLQFWDLKVGEEELQWVGSEDGIGGRVVLTIDPSGDVHGAAGWNRGTRYRNQIASDRDNRFALVRFPADVPEGQAADASIVWRNSGGVDTGELSMSLVDAATWGWALDLGADGTLAVHAAYHTDAISTYPEGGDGWTTKVPRSSDAPDAPDAPDSSGVGFVHALTHDSDGNLYALVMEQIRHENGDVRDSVHVLKLTAQGAVEWSAALDQERGSAFGLALRVVDDGSVVAVSKGVETVGEEWFLRVHQVSPDGAEVTERTAATLHSDGKFTAAAVAPDGEVYASGHCHADYGVFGVTSPWTRDSCQSFIVGVSPDGIATELWSGPANSRVLALSVDSTGGLVAASAQADSVHLNRHITDGVLRIERFSP